MDSQLPNQSLRKSIIINSNHLKLPQISSVEFDENTIPNIPIPKPAKNL